MVLNDLEKKNDSFEIFKTSLTLIKTKLNEINSDLDRIEKEVNFLDLIEVLLENEGVKDFTNFTLKVIDKKEEHIVTTTFLLGLQNVSIVSYERLMSSFNLVPTYTNTSDEIDCLEIISNLCGENMERWQECLKFAQQTLAHYITLWNVITDLYIRKVYAIYENEHSTLQNNSPLKRRSDEKLDLHNLDTVKLYETIVSNLMLNRLYFTSSIVNSIFISGIDSFNRNKKGEVGLLTQREIEIIKHICKGYSNITISEQLGLSKRTVDNHRQSVLRKLQVKNTVGLVLFAIENGLVKKGLSKV